MKSLTVYTRTFADFEEAVKLEGSEGTIVKTKARTKGKTKDKTKGKKPIVKSKAEEITTHQTKKRRPKSKEQIEDGSQDTR